MPEDSKLFKTLYFGYYSATAKRRHARKDKMTLNVLVTDLCNLNCRGCSLYSPLVKEPRMLDISSYEQDIKRLSEIMTGGSLEKVVFSGGETLLYKDLTDVLYLTKRYFPDTKLSMITNGILLNKMEEDFWKCCHETDTEIEITAYPIKLKYDEILQLAGRYDVNVLYFTTNAWQTERLSFRKVTMSEAGNMDTHKNFKKCCYTLCWTLQDGNIYRCPKMCFTDVINNYFGTKFEVKECDYIDIYKVKDKEEFFDLSCKPIQYCRYCDLDNWQFGIPWGISKKQKEEWI